MYKTFFGSHCPVSEQKRRPVGFGCRVFPISSSSGGSIVVDNAHLEFKITEM